MIKQCVVCEKEFVSSTSTKTCSDDCWVLNHKDKVRQQHLRYVSKDPDKAKALRSEARRRYEERNKEKVVLARKSRKEAKAALLAERQAKNLTKACVHCGSGFIARNNVNTCSDACWIANRIERRNRPERLTVKENYLSAKREKQNKLNAKRSAALQIVRQIEEKGIEALL